MSSVIFLFSVQEQDFSRMQWNVSIDFHFLTRHEIFEVSRWHVSIDRCRIITDIYRKDQCFIAKVT